jgi:hypothetical protein
MLELNDAAGTTIVAIAFWTMVAAVVIGPTIAVQWRKVHQAKSEMALKQAMVERGMSADEIVRVLRAGHEETIPKQGSSDAGHLKQTTDYKV